MKVGVLVPARNALKWIEQLLTTISAQTFPCAAYIVDDCSDDGMTKFLKDRPSWYRHMVRNEERTGWPGTLNRAAELAFADGCDAVFVAAADDFLRLDCIEKCARALGRNDWVIPYLQQVGAENVVQVSSDDIQLADFAIWPPLTDKAMFRREVWQAVGGYSRDITIPERPWGAAEDWEFWIKVFKAGFTDYEVIKEPLYYFRMHDQQLSRTRIDAHDLTVAAIRAKHPDVWELRRDAS